MPRTLRAIPIRLPDMTLVICIKGNPGARRSAAAGIKKHCNNANFIATGGSRQV
jgi:hypothetical protein